VLSSKKGKKKKEYGRLGLARGGGGPERGMASGSYLHVRGRERRGGGERKGRKRVGRRKSGEVDWVIKVKMLSGSWSEESPEGP